MMTNSWYIPLMKPIAFHLIFGWKKSEGIVLAAVGTWIKTICRETFANPFISTRKASSDGSQRIEDKPILSSDSDPSPSRWTGCGTRPGKKHRHVEPVILGTKYAVVNRRAPSQIWDVDPFASRRRKVNDRNNGAI